jgi:hypothetical protein
VIRNVTKLRPGEATKTSARSMVLTDTTPDSGRRWCAALVYKHLSSSGVKS